VKDPRAHPVPDGGLHGPVGRAEIERLDEPLPSSVELDEHGVLADLDDHDLEHVSHPRPLPAWHRVARLLEQRGE
jgi:hypothetical protein